MPVTTTPSSNRKRTVASGAENDHPNQRLSTCQSSKKKKECTSFFSNNSTCRINNKGQQQPTKPLKQTQASKNNSSRMRPMTSFVEAFPDLSPAEKKATLASIPNAMDRNLQVIVFEVDCNYVLLQHQFHGVRALVGVPDDFPGKMMLKEHNESSPEAHDNAVFDWVVKVLRNCKPRRKGSDRGVLLADDMGLGKTVQAVVACLLRNAIARCKETPIKPTLIVSPNNAVLTQWHETLLKAGVDGKRIFRFVAKKTEYRLKGEIFVLCNRYDLQTEMRNMWGDAKTKTFKPSALLPNAPRKCQAILKNQYLSEKGKEENFHIDKEDKVTISEIVTDTLGEYMDCERTYQTVCIDEAHFLKSLVTYWGAAAGLLGIHAERMIAMSGTPFNNSTQDLASLMTYIDPLDESANEKWWKKATKSSAACSVVESIRDWNQAFLIRRGKDVIAANLPTKTVTCKHVAALPLELFVYEKYENDFLNILQKFQKLEKNGWNPVSQKRMRQYFEVMLAYAGCMRSALIHPLLPGGGRNFTVFFSPTRSCMSHVLTSLEKHNRCVCCKRQVKAHQKEKNVSQEQNDNLDNLEDENINGEDDDLMVDDVEEVEAKNKDFAFDSNKGTGEIVAIPATMCKTAEKGIRHFACESCVEDLEEKGAGCPLCETLIGRLRLDSGRQDLLRKKKEGTKHAGSVAAEEGSEDFEIYRRVYCKNLWGGFRASAKLESIIEDFFKIPVDEKALVVSFFKGSLDLLEAMFHDLGIETARFDGDIPNDAREDELDRFKDDSSNCRVLLMTVQTGGTGLNLVCANHVWFVDRFWNPMVMAQCEDRCYRLGQKKDVDITYHDVNMTIDTVMSQINEVKSDNATILLADGSTALSAGTAGLSFKDISGCLGNAIRMSRSARITHVVQGRENITLPLPSTIVDLLQAPSNITPQYNSIVEAIASLLGYELPVHRPSKVLSHNAVPVAPPSSQKPTPMDTTSSYNMELDEPKPAPVSRSSNSGFLADSDDEDEFDAKIEFGKKT